MDAIFLETFMLLTNQESLFVIWSVYNEDDMPSIYTLLRDTPWTVPIEEFKTKELITEVDNVNARTNKRECWIGSRDTFRILDDRFHIT